MELRKKADVLGEKNLKLSAARSWFSNSVHMTRGL